MTNSVRESSDSRDGSLCESSLNNSPAERRERIARLRMDPTDIRQNVIAHSAAIDGRPVLTLDAELLASNIELAILQDRDLVDAILSSDLVGTDQKKSIAQSDHQTEQSPTSQV